MIKKIKEIKVELLDKAETRKFNMSEVFCITDVYQHQGMGYTFFHVDNSSCIKDIKFDDTLMQRQLGARMAKSGFYYLWGYWEFEKKDANTWLAYRTKVLQKTIVYEYE